MARRNTHIIHRQEYQLAFEGSQDRLGIANKISQMYQKVLEKKLDPLFSRLGPPGKVVRIEKVEFDLGVIDATDLNEFEKQFASRIEAQVRELVEKLIANGTPREFTGDQARLDTLRFFLEKGRLPWWAESGTSLPGLLEIVWEDAPRRHWEKVLKEVLAKPAARRRLLLQLPQSHVWRLLENKLNPDVIKWLQAREELNFSGRNLALREAQTSEMLRQLAWDTLLEDVFVKEKGVNKQEFLARLAQLKASAAKRAFEPLYTGTPISGSPSSETSESQEISDIDLLTFFLLNGRLPAAMASLGAESLEVRFLTLARESRSKVRRILSEIVYYPQALDRLLYQFSPDLISALMDAVEEGLALFVQQLTDVLTGALPSSIRGKSARKFIEAFVLKYVSQPEWEEGGRKGMIQAFLKLCAELPDVQLERVLATLSQSPDAQKEGASLALEAEIGKWGVPEKLDAWMVFLQQGVLPATFTGTPADLLDQLLQEAPGALSAAMREVLLSATVLTRLTRQMPSALLSSLTEVLSPGSGKQVPVVVRELSELVRGSQVASFSEGKVEAWVWRLLLAGMLRPDRSETGLKPAMVWESLLVLAEALDEDPGKLLQGLIQRFTASESRGVRALGRLLAKQKEDLPEQALPPLEGMLVQEIPLPERPVEDSASVQEHDSLEAVTEAADKESVHAEESLPELASTAARLPESPEEEDAGAVAALMAKLQELLERGFLEKEDPPAFLEYCLKEAPARTRQMIKSYVGNPRVRMRLVTWLEGSSWRELLGWQQSEPEAQTDALRQDMRLLLLGLDTGGLPEVDRNMLVRLVDEAFLEALLENPDADEAYMLRKALALLAENWNLPLPTLLLKLRQQTEAVLSDLKTPMRILLGRLAKKKRVQHLKETGKLSRKKKPEGEERDLMEDAALIHNAGLVILSPFLAQYFKILGLRENQQYVSEHAASRAVHLLQYLATGQTETPEHELLLNKVLCGIPLEQPVELGITLQENEAAVSEQLLLGVIQNWATIKRSSIAALRETFLQREGFLLETEEMWKLRVTEGPFDMILDTLPWSISMVKLSWMEKILQVEWR